MSVLKAANRANRSWGWVLGGRVVQGIRPTFEELAVGAVLAFRDRLNQPRTRSRLRYIFKFVSFGKRQQGVVGA